MKIQILIITSFVIFTNSYSQTFEFSIVPEKVNLIAGTTSTLPLDIRPTNYTYQIFLANNSRNLPSTIDINFTTNPLIFPYNNGHATVTVQGGTPIGDYELIIMAYNGPVVKLDTCFLSIQNSICDWENYPQPNVSENQNLFYDLAIDSENNFWVTSSNYLVQFNKNTGYQLIPLSDLNLNGFLKDIVIDKFNNKWINNSGTGLYKHNSTESILYTPNNSPLPSTHINDLVIDQNNLIWIATDQGLANFDGTFWTTYNSSNTILTNNILSIAVNSKGTIYAIGYSDATFSKEIFKFENQS